MNIADVLVVAFRESIMHAVPKIIALLSGSELNVRRAGVDALARLSEQGMVSNFLT